MPLGRLTPPKGTRDFDAVQVFRRRYILDILQRTYQKYGFLPLETPALEHLDTLMGKYGQEGDQLLYKVLNSGDFLADVELNSHTSASVLPHIASKGLRYDLTVPLMRYVATNSSQIAFPFRRYQIQPVWRADRPQKGRYREFWQCDIDVVGTESLLCEAEIISLIHEVLHRLKLSQFSIHINHRGVLRGLATMLGAADQETALCVALDKLDKVGKANVLTELRNKGLSAVALEQLDFIFALPTAAEARWEVLTNRLQDIPVTTAALQDLRTIHDQVQAMGLGTAKMLLDPTLARGLSYYTGTVLEVKLQDSTWGSIGGGGRYDHLTDVFGLPNVSGVGFSFGLDRLYATLESLALFPAGIEQTTQVMLAPLDDASTPWALKVLATLRTQDICAILYPASARLKKQLQYADRCRIPFVGVIGEEECAAQTIALKDMAAGTQQPYTLDQLVDKLS
ncbi:MAG: histidine--tRNA ligase [Bacteroidota bacterium]